MTGVAHLKRYQSPARAERALLNWAWLYGLDSGLPIPHAWLVDETTLATDWMDGRHPSSPDDLALAAEALGRLDAAAHRRIGRRHRLDEPFHGDDGFVIADFTASRRDALRHVDWPLDQLAPAIYKDANLRNVILTSAGVAPIDFDDLTLAPFGYDLAKLVVSFAMTFGPFPSRILHRALDAYNQTISASIGVGCDRGHFDLFIDLHDRMTAPYLGRNGYQYPWTPPRSEPQR